VKIADVRAKRGNVTTEQGKKGTYTSGLVRHLRRQALWLKESYLWLLKTKILPEHKAREPPAHALDVGCGPGFVMDIFNEFLDVRGVDTDPDMVAMCRSRGFDVELAEAESLPFADEEFDVAYCSFLLMWTQDPAKAVNEMARVSKTWVLCLAEPDFGARIDYPAGLSPLNELLIKGLQKDGGDPFMGRRLRTIFQECGLGSEMGIHPGVWDVERLGREFEDEWRWVEMISGDEVDARELERVRQVWEEALRKGTLFQFNPVFYCLGRK